jgi:GT2 family glycosyltransferase
MKLWICIPVHNRLSFTKHCLASLWRQTWQDYQVVVCDDGSTDGTAELIRSEYPEVALIEGNGELWWTGATNCCVEYALAHAQDDDAIVTLNNDLEVEENYLEELARVAERYPLSLIGSAAYDIKNRKLVDPGFRHNWITAASRRLHPQDDHLPDDNDTAEVTHLPGRGTLIPVKIFKSIGLFDFKHLPHYGADYDFSFRARRHGFRTLIAYQARVFSHVEETGLHQVRKRFSLQGFAQYLTSRKSPGALRSRFWLAVNNCPPLLLPIYLGVDTCRVFGSYIRHFMGARS